MRARRVKAVITGCAPPSTGLPMNPFTMGGCPVERNLGWGATMLGPIAMRGADPALRPDLARECGWKRLGMAEPFPAWRFELAIQSRRDA